MKRTGLLLIGALAFLGCQFQSPSDQKDQQAANSTGGDAGRGKATIERYGCTSCHTIPGLAGDANVGPPLNRIGTRVYVAGVLTNNPANIKRWIEDPPAVDPKTAMPNLGVKPGDLEDIVAYLYTLR
jgi:cytochrome c